MQERFSSPVKESTSDAHTVPLPRSPTTYCAVLLSGSIRQAIKYQPPLTREKGGSTDSSRIKEPVSL